MPSQEPTLPQLKATGLIAVAEQIPKKGKVKDNIQNSGKKRKNSLERIHTSISQNKNR